MNTDKPAAKQFVGDMSDTPFDLEELARDNDHEEPEILAQWVAALDRLPVGGTTYLHHNEVTRIA